MYYTYALYFLRYADNLLQLDNGVKVPPRLVLVISAFFLKFINGDAVALMLSALDFRLRGPHLRPITWSVCCVLDQKPSPRSASAHPRI